MPESCGVPPAPTPTGRSASSPDADRVPAAVWAIAAGSLGQHQAGRIDACDEFLIADAGCRALQGEAGPDSDLQYTLSQLRIEQIHRPGISLAIRGAAGHDPACDVAPESSMLRTCTSAPYIQDNGEHAEVDTSPRLGDGFEIKPTQHAFA